MRVRQLRLTRGVAPLAMLQVADQFVAGVRELQPVAAASGTIGRLTPAGMPAARQQGRGAQADKVRKAIRRVQSLPWTLISPLIFSESSRYRCVIKPTAYQQQKLTSSLQAA